MHLYDLMKSPIVCPYCGNSFDEGDIKLKRKTAIGASEDISKTSVDFDFPEDEIEEDDAAVLEDDDMDNDLDVLKITEVE